MNIILDVKKDIHVILSDIRLDIQMEIRFDIQMDIQFDIRLISHLICSLDIRLGSCFTILICVL